MPIPRRAALHSLAALLPAALGGCLQFRSDQPDIDVSVGGGSTRSTSRNSTGPRTARTTESTETETPPETETRTPKATPTPPAPDSVPVTELDPSALSSRGVPSAFDTSDVAEEPFLALVVGKASDGSQSKARKPHQVWVTNDAEATVAADLTLGNLRGTIAERTVEFEANTTLCVVFRAPMEYVVTVDTGDVKRTDHVPYSQFDCNDSATDFVYRDSGKIELGTVSTAVACSTPVDSR